MAAPSTLSLAVVVFFAAVGTTAIAAEYEDAPIPTAGASFAQGTVSFQGAHVVSESLPENTDHFEQLDDEFDQHAQPKKASGSVLAQGSMKFDGARLVSESLGTDQFAKLDDEFDVQMNGKEEAFGASASDGAVKFDAFRLIADALFGRSKQFADLDDEFDDKQHKQTESRESTAFLDTAALSTYVFDVVTSPVLYFTIALLVFGSLFVTSERLPESVHQNPAPVDSACSKEGSPPESVEQTPTPTGSKRSNLLQPAKPEVAEATATSSKVKAPAPICTDDEAQPPCEEESREELAQALQTAAEACRAGEAGSYANFCKLLAEQQANI